ncbi:MAG: rhodanese-like domain-containing protein [Bacilli bacterium]
MEAIDTAALRDRVYTERVVLLDVRPQEEYANGHWPGSWSVPLNTLADRLADLPQDRTVVAYCRGPYCVLALHAVELLRERGFHAVRLTDGVSEWRARGDPIVHGAES